MIEFSTDRGSFIRKAVRRGLGLPLTAALLAGVYSGANSAPGTATQDQKPGGAEALEEVVVTSERRIEPLLQVPLSVTALTEQSLTNLNARNFEDYARTVPGLSFVESPRFARGGLQPVIRGVTPLGGIFPTTAFYLGETPLQPSRRRLGFIDPNLFDIRGVEVLRGPQGDLYGSSSMGGAIKVIPNAPNASAFDAAIDTRGGTITNGSETFEFNGMLNLPLVSDHLALRLVGLYAYDGGFIDYVKSSEVPGIGSQSGVGLGLPAKTLANHDLNTVKTVGTRASLKWDVTDRLTVTPSYFMQEVTEGALNYVSGPLTMAAGSPTDIDFGVGENARNRFSSSNLEINYDLGWASLMSSTTSFDVTNSGVFGATGLVGLVLGGGVFPTAIEDVEKERHFVQEVRLTSKSGRPVEFTTGLYYRDVTYSLDQYFNNDDLIPIIGTGLLFSRQGEDTTTKEKAVYGRATWHMTDKWDFSPGVRYSKYTTHTFIPTTGGILGYPTENDVDSASNVSPSASVRFAPTQNTSIYARAANGFRPGYSELSVFPPACDSELAALGVDSNAAIRVKSDKIWNYELGYKGRFLDGRLSANLSAYRIDWKDQQLTVVLNCGFGVPGNAGAVRNQGGELELQALVMRGLTAQFSAGFVDAKLRDSAPSVGGKAGDRMIGVPRVSFEIGAQYDWMVGEHAAFARLDYAYQGDSYYTFSFTPENRRPALGLLSGRLGMNYRDFEFAIYGKNLLNEDKLNMCQREVYRSVSPDYSTCTVRPREVGVQVRWALGSHGK